MKDIFKDWNDEDVKSYYSKRLYEFAEIIADENCIEAQYGAADWHPIITHKSYEHKIDFLRLMIIVHFRGNQTTEDLSLNGPYSDFYNLSEWDDTIPEFIKHN